MTMTEMSRLIKGLRKEGWSAEKINNFLLYIESGEEPQDLKKDENKES